MIITPYKAQIITQDLIGFHAYRLRFETPATVHCCVIDIQQVSFKIESLFVVAVLANRIFGVTQSI